jgi:hypothetical protein
VRQAPPGRRARGTVAVVVGLALAGACAPRPRSAPPAAEPLDAVVLVEVHRIDGAIDTLVTWIAPDRVRVSHQGGDAILDAARDRFLLLDPTTRSVRETSLSAWESRIRAAAVALRAAADSSAGGAPPLGFAASGDGGEVAGYACQRHHLYAERPLFPGEWEEIEQEIWVAPALELPAGAGATYRRVFEILDWIDFDAHVERPAGVRLRLEQRRRPRGAGADATETEATQVVRVERRRVAAAIFAAPPGWTRADSLRD